MELIGLPLVEPSNENGFTGELKTTVGEVFKGTFPEPFVGVVETT
jgi:hypothetical protein